MLRIECKTKTNSYNEWVKTELFKYTEKMAANEKQVC